MDVLTFLATIGVVGITTELARTLGEIITTGMLPWQIKKKINVLEKAKGAK